jgi:thiol-disulfide isomerase/thioredoxin
VMVLTAVAMAFQLDIRFQTAIADHLPAAVVNPTGSLEKSKTVSDKLATLRPASRFENASRATGLDDYGPAPDFAGNDHWFNSKPLTLASLRGRVVLIDFWTYTCINCIRTFPHLKAWDAKYRDKGLTIVGVHSPEFGFEKKASNVARAIRQNGLVYPVAQDNELATWNAWSNQYWPAEYLIDARGHVRYANFGEGDTDKTEAAIRSLLADAGATDLGGDAKPDRQYDPSAEATPETYLGADRAERFLPGVQQPGTATYTPYAGDLPESHFTLGGRWRITGESATAGPGATLRGNVTGKDVYLVLSGPGDVDVRVDGRHEQTVHVTSQKLYHLLSRPKAAAHDLRLTFTPGVSAFAFTFG